MTAVVAKDPQTRPAPGVVTSGTRPVVLRVEPEKRRGCWRAWVDYRDGLEPREILTDGPKVQLFIESFCVCTDGQWVDTPLKLLPWQKDWLVELFELDPETGLRRYREALLGVPKKNGKSGLLAGVAHYLLVGDGEPAAKVVVAGAGEESANNIFEPAKSMVLRSGSAKVPGMLSELVAPWEDEITLLSDPESKIFRVAGSPKQTEGKNLAFVLIDEWHEWDLPRLEQNATKLIERDGDAAPTAGVKITTPAGTCRRCAGGTTSTGSGWRRGRLRTGGSSSGGSKRRRSWTGGARSSFGRRTRATRS